MSLYKYIALDRSGNRVTGHVSAAESETARQLLDDRGLRAEQLEKVGAERARLTKSETAELASHLADATQVGLPLVPGLRAVSEELAAQRHSRRLAATLSEIADRLEAGKSLPVAIEEITDRIPVEFRGIVQAGLRSSNLDETLVWFVERSRRDAERARQILAALGYPLVTLALLAALFLFVSTAVVPELLKMIRDTYGEDEKITNYEFTGGLLATVEYQLPYSTRLLIWLYVLIRPLMIVLVITVVAARFLTRLRGVGHVVDRCLHWIPLAGRIAYYSAVSEMAGVLGMLLRQGLPLPDALRLAGGTLRDRSISRACASMAGEVAAGSSLAESLRNRGPLLQTLVPVVKWAEHSGALIDSLDYVEKTYSGWATIQTDYVRTVFPPFAFVLVVWGVVVIVMGLFQPMVHWIGMFT